MHIDPVHSYRTYPERKGKESKKGGSREQHTQKRNHDDEVKKHTPMKQTNSSLQTVLLALLLEGGHLGPEPSQKAESRQPLSSRHLTPYLSWQDSVQHGPCVVIIVIDLTCKTKETQMGSYLRR